MMIDPQSSRISEQAGLDATAPPAGSTAWHPSFPAHPDGRVDALDMKRRAVAGGRPQRAAFPARGGIVDLPGEEPHRILLSPGSGRPAPTNDCARKAGGDLRCGLKPTSKAE